MSSQRLTKELGNLEREHERIDRLFESLAAGEAGPDSRELAGRLRAAIGRHLEHEERFFRTVGDQRGTTLLLESVRVRHEALRRALARWDATAEGSPGWNHRLGALRDNAQALFRFEEEELFDDLISGGGR